ncbi:MAG: DUF1638 domain-containing protein [Methanomassiliicoccales archaeon]|nr:DUF1638 domain-containing protein [Methanomassiliicoccales archaeon]
MNDANGPNALGIVGCQVLEDEMAYVVASDEEADNVLIIDSTMQKTITDKIKRMAPKKNVHCIDENCGIREYQMPSGTSVILWLKPIGLHQSPPLLREEVLKAINRIEPLAQSILIFYGQCGNAFRSMEMITAGARVPVTILRDDDGALIDDCFGTELGGRDEYRDFLIGQTAPAYVLNTMWAANWRIFMHDMQMLRDPNNVEEAKEVFRYMDYRTAVGLNTGLGDLDAFERRLQEFASIFDLELEHHRATLKIVERSYGEAKRLLREPPLRVNPTGP